MKNYYFINSDRMRTLLRDNGLDGPLDDLAIRLELLDKQLQIRALQKDIASVIDALARHGICASRHDVRNCH